MRYRTDLAIENKELIERDNSECQIPGIIFKKWQYDNGIDVAHIKIIDEKGETAFGRKRGNYITIEANNILDGCEEIKESVAEALSEVLKGVIEFNKQLKFLVVGLGNKRITPDSLGPTTLEKIDITRHIFLSLNISKDDEMSCVSGFVPGVMGTTGIETLDLIKKAVELVEPDYVIVIDSLAARNIDRVSTTIQVNDTGIAPGAGLGNYRKELTEESIGRKVVAIGVPTVIDSTTLVLDALDSFINDEPVINKYVKKNVKKMIVTPTDIDIIINEFSSIIAKGINKTLHPGI